MKQWLIIDVYNLLYRSFYGLKPLYTSSNIPINAIFGFCKTFIKLINKYKSNYIIAALDKSTLTLIRRALYSEYKANREQAPLELENQKKHILDLLKMIDVLTLSQDGYEADDFIALTVDEIKKRGDKGVIVSADKDLHYLIDDFVIVYDPSKDIELDLLWVKKKYGNNITRETFFLYFSLVGDASDNIPGVKGIGPKMAEFIISKYHSLDNLYNSYMSDISLKQRTKDLLKINKDNAYLSLSLCLPIKIERADLFINLIEWNKDSIKKAYPFFLMYEFYSLISKSEEEPEFNNNLIDASSLFKTFIIQTEEEFYVLKEKIKKAKYIGLDSETRGVFKKNHELVGYSICLKKGEAYYIPLKSPNKIHDYNLAINLLQFIAENKKIIVIMHHCLFDFTIFASYGIYFKYNIFDTLLAASLCFPADQKKGLKDLSLHLFNEKMTEYNTLVDKNKYNDISEVSLDLVAIYACADAHQTLKVYECLINILKKLELESLFYSLEMPLVNVLHEMQEYGMTIAVDELYDAQFIIDNLLVELQKEVEDEVGFLPGTLNIRSSKQVSDLLVNHLGITMGQKTKISKQLSTDQESLDKIKHMHPIIKKIIDFRTHSSIKSRCIDNFIENINPISSKVHPSYNYFSIHTGRITSYDPNVQNIPQEYLGLPYSIRKAFIAPTGRVLISLDYSQIELRVLAYLSNDLNLIDIFKKEEDIHLKTAEVIYNKKDISIAERQAAKVINFSILYGASAFRISNELSISPTEAKLYIDVYKSKYKEATQWMEKIIDDAKAFGYVRTLLGRRRNVFELRDKNKHIQAEGARISINTIIQGSAAELLKQGLLNVRNFLKREYANAKIILQIYDEIIIECDEKDAEVVSIKVKKIMEEVVSWNLPILVNFSIGKNWQKIS